MKNLNKYYDTLKLTGITLLLILVSSFDAKKPDKQKTKKPNIIVILSDDAGYNDFEAYGGKQIPTPNINSIGAQGVKFTNAYVTASVCGPSRAGLLTGRYQQRFGYEFNPIGKPTQGYTNSDIGMDTQERTIGNEMQANGYKTILIGKWHQGYEEKYYPLNRGFDQFYGFKGGTRPYFPTTNANDGQILMANKTSVPENEITYLTDMFTNKATSFISENKDKPFFMYLSYNAVHMPMQGKKEMIDHFASIPTSGRRVYAALMTSLDEGVGKVLAALKTNKIDDNTLVIFLNDNGGPLANSSDNGVLRGLKGSVWEGGIRVAFMMKWSGHITENSIYKNPVSYLDILPTSIAAANGKQAGNKKLDGVNLLPYLNKNHSSLPHKVLFWRQGALSAVRAGKWKLVREKSNSVSLFDLDNDLSETTNMVNDHPDIVKGLLVKLDIWEKGLAVPRWSDKGED